MHIFFSPAARGWLQVWLERTGVAIASRQAAVRESYEKAKYFNLQDLRKKQKEANRVLDKRTIQLALDKCQPRQRMCNTLQTTEHVVCLSGDGEGLSICFSGPRRAGDFIAHWSSAIYPNVSIPLWQAKAWIHTRSAPPVCARRQPNIKVPGEGCQPR